MPDRAWQICCRCDVCFWVPTDKNIVPWVEKLLYFFKKSFKSFFWPQQDWDRISNLSFHFSAQGFTWFKCKGFTLPWKKLYTKHHKYLPVPGSVYIRLAWANVHIIVWFDSWIVLSVLNELPRAFHGNLTSPGPGLLALQCTKTYSTRNLSIRIMFCLDICELKSTF